MMPSDELWIELTAFDASLGDGIWDGAIPPDDAPRWSHRLGTLIAAARGPAALDELSREAEILADMLAVTSEHGVAAGGGGSARSEGRGEGRCEGGDVGFGDVEMGGDAEGRAPEAGVAAGVLERRDDPVAQ
jgi:hypothetical protein